MRVVLYAEGAGEEGTAARMAPTPGTVLQEEWLGPAHELVRRCLEEADGSARVQAAIAPAIDEARRLAGEQDLDAIVDGPIPAAGAFRVAMEGAYDG